MTAIKIVTMKLPPKYDPGKATRFTYPFDKLTPGKAFLIPANGDKKKRAVILRRLYNSLAWRKKAKSPGTFRVRQLPKAVGVFRVS